MNNDRPPAWNMGKVLTINCESSLGGLTISQFAINTVNDYLDMNSTLVFLPGNHSLYHKLVIKNVSRLTITALFPMSQATFTCIDCAGFVFRGSHRL